MPAAPAAAHPAGAPAERPVAAGLGRRRGCRVIGGVRADPRVNPVRRRVGVSRGRRHRRSDDAVPGGPLPPGVTPADAALIDGALPRLADARARVLVVRTTTSGDWSTYTLFLLGDGGTGVPAGFDAPLGAAPFTFTVDCPSRPRLRGARRRGTAADRLPAAGLPRPRLRGAARPGCSTGSPCCCPAGRDRNPADPAVMLAELFAAPRRPARVLAGRRRGGGVPRAPRGSRTVRAPARPPARLRGPRGLLGAGLAGAPHRHRDDAAGRRRRLRPCLSRRAAAAGARPTSSAPPSSRPRPTSAVAPARNDAGRCTPGATRTTCLPAGTTAAFLAVPDRGRRSRPRRRGRRWSSPTAPPAAGGRRGVATRHAGSRCGSTGNPASTPTPCVPSSPCSRSHWHADDALPVPLRVSEPGPDGRPAVRAVALANVVLADHGATVAAEPLIPPQPPSGLPYRPRLLAARAGVGRARGCAGSGGERGGDARRRPPGPTPEMPAAARPRRRRAGVAAAPGPHRQRAAGRRTSWSSRSRRGSPGCGSGTA